MDTKLKVGDIILIHGFVMLNKLECGKKYRVTRVEEHFNNIFTYTFARAKGRKNIWRHRAGDVDPWIGNDKNLNYIEVVSQSVLG